MKARTKRLAARLFLTAISLVVLMLVLETALRIFYPQEIVALTMDPEIGWKLRPDTEGVWRREVNNACGYTRIRINHLGLRESSLDTTPDFAVWMAGDSFIEASNVDEDETATEILETMLSQDRRSEVVNLGVRGYGPIHTYHYLRRFFDNQQLPAPDVVVLSLFSGNDFHESYTPQSSPSKITAIPVGNGIQENPVQSVGLPRRLIVGLAHHSHLLRFVRMHMFSDENPVIGNFLRRLGILSTRMTVEGLTIQERQNMLTVAHHYVLAIRDLVHTHNARLIVAFIGPEVYGDEDHNRHIRWLRNELTELLQKDAIQVIDLNAATAPQYSQSQLYIKGSGHFSVLGNRVYADLIYQQLSPATAR